MVMVQTKEEFRKAIERNEQEVLITDATFAGQVIKYKQLAVIIKRIVTGMAVLAGIGILLAPFFGLPFAMGAAALASLAAGIISIEFLVGMRSIGTAALYSLYKVYHVEREAPDRIRLKRQK